MTLHTVPAHFDGKQVRIDKPVSLKENAKLWVSFVTSDDDENFEEEWGAMAMAAMAALHEREENKNSKAIVEG